MANAVAGVGTVFQRLNPNTDTWEDIAEINSIEGPNEDRDTIEVTSLDTEGGYDEFITGFMEGGTLVLNMNFNRSGYEVMKQDFEIDLVRNYRIVLPDDENTTLEFEGLVTEIPITMEADNQLTADVTIQVSGEVTIASAGAESSVDVSYDQESREDESSGSFVIYDTFTGSDDLLLRYHRPDVGLIDSTGFPDNYIYDHGYVKLSGNRAHSTATGQVGAQAIIESGLTDPDISIDLDIPASGYYMGGIISRWKDNNEFFRIVICNYSPTGGHEYCQIFKYDTLVTEVDLGAVTSGVGKLRAIWTGNFVTVYWRGNKVIDNFETDGSFSTYSAHGIFLYRNDAGGFSECYIDELKIK